MLRNFKNTFIVFLAAFVLVSFTTGCESIDGNTTLSSIGKAFQKATEGISNSVVDEISEGIDGFENGRIIKGEMEDGAISYDNVITVKPFKLENIEMDGSVVFTEYQPDAESPVISGELQCSLRAIYRPLLNGLFNLGFPIITKVNIDGTIDLEGVINETMDISVVVDVMTNPKTFSCVINDIDIGEVIKKEIEKMNNRKNR